MAPIVLSEFSLAVDIDVFLELFWSKAGWYEEFLTHKLKDLSVNVGEWAPSPEGNSAQARTICSYHPSKISFPGLPSHAESWKAQTLEVIKDTAGSTVKVSVRETNSFRGIPYADYFNVNTEWTVVSVTANAPAGASTVKATIHLDFQFHKSTWLQGTIESNTKAELIEVYELWLQSAQETIRRNMDRRAVTSSLSAGNLRLAAAEAGQGGDVETGNAQASGEEDEDGGTRTPGDDSSEGAEQAPRIESGSSTPSRPLRKSRSYDGTRSGSGSEYPSDDELQFYDCEDVRDAYGGSAGSAGGGSAGSAGDAAGRMKSALSADLQRYYPHSRSSTIGDLGGISAENKGGKGEYLHEGFPVPGSHEGGSSARDIAVTIVETVFVMAGFAYWRVHQLYAYDLKEVFDIEPGKVLSRVLNSFLPGWHSPLLLHPDLYGPVLAVASLPQSLLLSMEISRHGCNPTSQLGNALVVSLFIWVGLSGLYRLLALVVAPSIELKHCLCVTGYGFFAWNVALLCIYPLENFSEWLNIPTMLPLVIFGIPSSLAQGAMFWEHTPASSMTLQPSQLPPSIQQFATTHNRCLQRLLTALPKIVAFLLVAGTHYQFLWYMARVFLPGRRQLCRLSALVQPSHYADILTQKELRNFAISLFGKG